MFILKLYKILSVLIVAIILSLTSCNKEVACGKCYGKGEIPEQSETCHRCNGSGVTSKTCSTCKGEKIVKNTASYGTSMRDFISRPSKVECSACSGYGKIKFTCSSCKGVGKVTTPRAKCDVCEGNGVVSPVSK